MPRIAKKPEPSPAPTPTIRRKVVPKTLVSVELVPESKRRTLKAFLTEYQEQQGLTYSEVLSWFHDKSGVSRVTLDMLVRGGKLRRWDKAQAIQSASGGVVSAVELM